LVVSQANRLSHASFLLAAIGRWHLAFGNKLSALGIQHAEAIS
jgi:hypothetical protein